MHRLAVMSKDGDWIVREDDEALRHVLAVLEERGARCRFGAPLDVRWTSGGWSSHFEFRTDVLRVRADFVTRPPRITPEALAGLWSRAEQHNAPVPFVDAATLAELKKTNREKDYAVIGELARSIADPLEQMLFSRSARDLLVLARDYPNLLDEAAARRPVLSHVREGRDALETALDAERRRLMRAHERRLRAYMEAAKAWADAWPSVAAEIRDLPLREAHRLAAQRAQALLPMRVEVPES